MRETKSYAFKSELRILLFATLTVTVLPVASRADGLLGQGGLTSSAAAQAETARRQEVVFQANAAIENGIRLYDAGEFDSAAEKFNWAVSNVSPGGQTAPLFQKAAAWLARAKVAQASLRIKEDQYAEAVELCLDAVVLDPTNKQYREDLAYARKLLREWEQDGRNPEGTRNNEVLTEEFVGAVQQVDRLLFEADRYYDTGQYQNAIHRCKQVLAIDPYNKAAREKMEKINLKQYHIGAEQRKWQRKQALSQVVEDWHQKVPANFGQPKDAGTETTVDPSDLALMLNKLSDIRIPSLNFDRLDVEQAIEFLRAKSKALDPNGKGINFVLKLQPTVAGEGTDGAEPTPIIREVSLNLTDAPLIEVLRFISDITNLEFKVEPYAVLFLPPGDAPNVLNTRTYNVPGGFFPPSLRPRTPPPGSTETTRVDNVVIEAEPELKNKGINFPPGASAFYLATSAKVVMKNTPEMLDLLAQIIANESEQKPQVEIEAKFAEFSDDALKALSFNYYTSFGESLGTLSDGTAVDTESYSALRTANFVPFGAASPNTAGVPNQIGGILPNNLDIVLASNDPGISNTSLGPRNFLLNSVLTTDTFTTFQLGGVIDGTAYSVIVQAVDNLTGVDLLTAPKVTTKDRAPAQIEVIRELRYPTEFESPDISNDVFSVVDFDAPEIIEGVPSAIDVFLGLPATPSEFEVQNIGVTMDVTPTLYNDQRIDLEITPEVVDFDGFINYGQPIFQRQTTEFPGQEGTPITNGIVNQPVFSVRSLTTKLQVLDGHTIIMGGLIREDRQLVDDKIPVLGDLPLLGRLFRSKAEKSVKRNLMIFVTARLINADGTPVYGGESVLPQMEDIPELEPIPEYPKQVEIPAQELYSVQPDYIKEGKDIYGK